MSEFLKRVPILPQLEEHNLAGNNLILIIVLIFYINKAILY